MTIKDFEINYFGIDLVVDFEYNKSEPEYFNYKEGYGDPGCYSSVELYEVITPEDVDLLPYLNSRGEGDLSQAILEKYEKK